MKNLFKLLLVSCTIIAAASCYNDKELREDISDIQRRLTALEETVNAMNGNITTLQGLVNALNGLRIWLELSKNRELEK